MKLKLTAAEERLGGLVDESNYYLIRARFYKTFLKKEISNSELFKTCIVNNYSKSS